MVGYKNIEIANIKFVLVIVKGLCFTIWHHEKHCRKDADFESLLFQEFSICRIIAIDTNDWNAPLVFFRKLGQYRSRSSRRSTVLPPNPHKCRPWYTRPIKDGHLAYKRHLFEINVRSFGSSTKKPRPHAHLFQDCIERKSLRCITFNSCLV